MKRFLTSIRWKDHIINFVSIVIGIYIAYWLTNIKENREKERLERTYLESLKLDLEADLKSLNENIDTLAYDHDMNIRFTKMLTRNVYPSDSIAAMLYSLNAHVPFFAQDNTYESIKSSGKLDLIEDFDLRQDIVRLYNQYYRSIKLTSDLDLNQKLSVIYPYLMEKPVFGGNGAVNASIFKETKFVNLVFANSYAVVQQVQYMRAGQEKCEQLIDEIDQYLKK